MVSRAPILHTYALTSLNYWKWDHPQHSRVPLQGRAGRLPHGCSHHWASATSAALFPVPLARWTKPRANWARLSFWFVRCCPLPFPLDFSVCCNSPGKFWSEALILFGLLGLRLRAGNSTLLLKAFFHLPCKTRQSPCILHIRTGQAFSVQCGNASSDFSPLSTSSSRTQRFGSSV